MRTDHAGFNALHLEAKGLSSRAARFALQLIGQSRQVPYQLVSLRIALIDSSRGAKDPTDSEWAALEDPERCRQKSLQMDAKTALDFAAACRRFIEGHMGPTRTPAEANRAGAQGEN